MNDLHNEIQRLGQINQDLTFNVDAKYRNIAETNDQFRQTLNQRLAEVLNAVQLLKENPKVKNLIDSSQQLGNINESLRDAQSKLQQKEDQLRALQQELDTCREQLQQAVNSANQAENENNISKMLKKQKQNNQKQNKQYKMLKMH